MQTSDELNLLNIVLNIHVYEIIEEFHEILQIHIQYMSVFQYL